MKKLGLKIGSDKITIDLGGDLDLGCCGCVASALRERLKKAGVRIDLQGVRCRLPMAERIGAKLSGKCEWGVANPLHEDLAIEDLIDRSDDE